MVKWSTPMVHLSFDSDVIRRAVDTLEAIELPAACPGGRRAQDSVR
jgi:hypothetical protein